MHRELRRKEDAAHLRDAIPQGFALLRDQKILTIHRLEGLLLARQTMAQRGKLRSFIRSRLGPELRDLALELGLARLQLFQPRSQKIAIGFNPIAQC